MDGLNLPNRESAVGDLQDQLEAFGRQQGLGPRVLHEAQLALEEHLTNIISHGYDDTLEHQIKVVVILSASELHIQVEDDGRPFNPLEQPAPDLSKPFEERPVGGLGIHMMRQSLDQLDYRRVDGKNILGMIKRI